MRSVTDTAKDTVITGQRPAGKDLRARQFRREPTRAEATLWHHLRAGRLDGWHFRRQQVIDGFITDFYCHAAGLIIELDGPVHEQQVEYDAERDRILRDRCLYLLRIRNEQVLTACPAVLALIRATLGRLTGPVRDPDGGPEGNSESSL